MRARVLALTTLLVGALARPACAWGVYAHALFAERAYAVLVPRHPWLAVHREAFVWGAVGPDLDRVAELSARRTHAPELPDTLWQLAHGDDDARAFALGWAAAAGADHAGEALQTRAGDTLRRLCAAPQDVSTADLVDWTADATLASLADHTLDDLFHATVSVALSPAAGAVRSLLHDALGLDEGTYETWTERIGRLSAQGEDAYLTQDADWLGIQSYTPVLRTANARLALGDREALLGTAVAASVANCERLLGSAHNPRSLGYGSKNPSPERKKP